MKFDIHTDYAVRALRLLHTLEGKALTAMDIAVSINTTSPIFTKIANKLKRAGLLKTVQGRGGGYVLGKSAHEISLYDVFTCIEGDLRINHCIETGGLCSHGEHVKCKAHGLFYGIQQDLVDKLSNAFISDLA